MADWWDRAACKDEDPATFFPHSRGAAQLAIHVCQACPVQQSCRDWANQFSIPYGVWAGHWRNPKMKWCPDCEQELPTSAFTQGQRATGGIRTYCKDCHNVRTRQYRKTPA